MISNDGARGMVPFKATSSHRRRVLETLEKRVHGDSAGVLHRQIPQPLRHVAKDSHPVIEREVSEQNRSRLQHVRVVLEESVFIHVRFVHLAFGSVFCDEPVVTKRLRILLPCDANELRGLPPESVELTGPDLQMRVDF